MQKLENMTPEEETALYQKLIGDPQSVLDHLNAKSLFKKEKLVRQTGQLMDLFIDTLFEAYFSPLKYKKMAGICKTCLSFIFKDAKEGAHDFLSHEDEVLIPLRMPKTQHRSRAFRSLLLQAADQPMHKKEIDGVVYMTPPGINRLHLGTRRSKPSIHTQLLDLYKKNGKYSLRDLQRGAKNLRKIVDALVCAYYSR